jgi:hypothetical protein
MRINTIKILASAVALTITSPIALAFFPPVTAPVNVPVTVVRNPVIDPVKTPTVVPPVEPCVKPQPKPRPKPQDCYCSTPVGTARTPEPATLVTAGIGAAVVSLFGWAKKQKRLKTSLGSTENGF